MPSYKSSTFKNNLSLVTSLYKKLSDIKKNLKKTIFFCSFWALFVHYSEKRTFLENLLLSLFFYFLVSIAVNNFRIKLLKRFRKKLATDIQTNEWIPRQAWVRSNSPAEDPININVYQYQYINIVTCSLQSTQFHRWELLLLNFSKMENNAQKFIWKYKMVSSYLIVFFPAIHSINAKFTRATLRVSNTKKIKLWMDSVLSLLTEGKPKI